MLFKMKRLICSERGELGEEEPTTETAPEQIEGTGETQDAVPEQALGTDPAQAADATQGEETFLTGEENLDPRKLPPEVQPIFKRMQAVYTKRMQNFAEIRDKASVVDRFYNDPGFAQQTLLGWAAQNGFQLVPVGQQGQPGAQTTNGAQKAPSTLVEAVKSNLPQELQWMAEPLAAAQAQAMQQMLSPVLQQQTAQQQQARVAEWDRYADELRGVAPGWEEHEDVMSEIYDFFTGPQLHHPKYGSKLEMLYNLATAKAAAIKTATDRVNAAAKNRASSGRTGVPKSPTLDNQVASARTSQDAWEIAKQHALKQLRSA